MPRIALYGLTLCALALFGVGVLFLKGDQGVPPDQPGAFGFEPGELVADFEYEAIDGRSGRFSELIATHDAVVVAMRMTECPVSRRYGHRLAEIEATYGDRNVAFVFLTVSPQDTRAKVADDLEVYGFEGPYIRDPRGRVGSRIQARVSSETFVFDGSGTLRYRGPVDDQFGIDFSKPEPRAHHLTAALDAVLEGRAVRRASVPASGCFLSYDEHTVPARDITYHSRISRLVQSNCVTCHREGGIAPFSLESYEQVYGFRTMIEYVVEEGRMPPWFASPAHGTWANDRSLSERDRRDLLAWIAAGAPEGDPALAAGPVEYVEGWDLAREPDYVITIPEPQEIPEQGSLDYRYVYVKTDFEQDLFLTSMEPRPTAVEQTHHIIVYLEAPDDERRGPFVAGWAPGMGATSYPEGHAKRIPAGSWLMFELHYTPNGRTAVDRSMFGFLATEEPPEREVFTSAVSTTRFEIPPHAENHEVTAELNFNRSGDILMFLPHMHLRGKAFRYDLVRADGREETILEVPSYDFNWQLWYEPIQVLRVEPGDRMIGTAWYDNSENNPANPDPDATVGFGLQSWEEMMFGFFDWAPLPREASPVAGSEAGSDRAAGGG